VIEPTPPKQLRAISGVRRRLDQEAFVSQEHAVGLEKLGFIVDPEHRLPVGCHAERM